MNTEFIEVLDYWGSAIQAMVVCNLSATKQGEYMIVEMIYSGYMDM